jgi:hypothetical protein
MATNTRTMAGLTSTDVFAVLADGWTYADWVVGTRKVRAVDDDWPDRQSRLHYTLGRWPLRKDDETRVVDVRVGELLELRVRAWPAGTARVVLRLSDTPDGARVEIEEHPQSGIGRALHNPVLDLVIKTRNVETLRRLEDQARRRRASG